MTMDPMEYLRRTQEAERQRQEAEARARQEAERQAARKAAEKAAADALARASMPGMTPADVKKAIEGSLGTAPTPATELTAAQRTFKPEAGWKPVEWSFEDRPSKNPDWDPTKTRADRPTVFVDKEGTKHFTPWSTMWLAGYKTDKEYYAEGGNRVVDGKVEYVKPGGGRLTNPEAIEGGIQGPYINIGGTWPEGGIHVTKKELATLEDLQGEKQFKYARKLGMVPEDAVYVEGKDGRWGYTTEGEKRLWALEDIRQKTDKAEYEKQLRDFEEALRDQADETKETRFVKAFEKGGVEGYNKEVESYNKEVRQYLINYPKTDDFKQLPTWLKSMYNPDSPTQLKLFDSALKRYATGQGEMAERQDAALAKLARYKAQDNSYNFDGLAKHARDNGVDDLQQAGFDNNTLMNVNQYNRTVFGSGLHQFVPKGEAVKNYFKEKGWEYGVNRGSATPEELKQYDTHLAEARQYYENAKNRPGVSLDQWRDNYFNERGWDIKQNRAEATLVQRNQYDDRLRESTAKYAEIYGKGAVVASGTAKVAQWVFLPARAIDPSVTIKDIKGLEWAIGGAQLALFAAPVVGVVGGRVIGVGGKALIAVGRYGGHAASVAIGGMTLPETIKTLSDPEASSFQKVFAAAISTALLTPVLTVGAKVGISKARAAIMPGKVTAERIVAGAQTTATDKIRMAEALRKQYGPEAAKQFDLLNDATERYIKALGKNKPNELLNLQAKLQKTQAQLNNYSQGGRAYLNALEREKSLKIQVKKAAAESIEKAEADLKYAVRRYTDNFKGKAGYDEPPTRVWGESETSAGQRIRAGESRIAEEIRQLPERVVRNTRELYFNSLPKRQSIKLAQREVERAELAFRNAKKKYPVDSARWEGQLSNLAEKQAHLTMLKSGSLEAYTKKLYYYREQLAKAENKLARTKPGSKARQKAFNEVTNAKRNVAAIQANYARKLKRLESEYGKGETPGGGGTRTATKPITERPVSARLAQELKRTGLGVNIIKAAGGGAIHAEARQEISEGVRSRNIPEIERLVRPNVTPSEWTTIEERMSFAETAKPGGDTSEWQSVEELINSALKPAASTVPAEGIMTGVEPGIGPSPGIEPAPSPSPQPSPQPRPQPRPQPNPLKPPLKPKTPPMRPPRSAVIPPPGNTASDKKKQIFLDTVEGAIARRRGMLRGKPVWLIDYYPYGPKNKMVMYTKPRNAPAVSGKGSLKKSAVVLWGTPPAEPLYRNTGAVDDVITIKGGKVEVKSVRDIKWPKMVDNGDGIVYNPKTGRGHLKL